MHDGLGRRGSTARRNRVELAKAVTGWSETRFRYTVGATNVAAVVAAIVAGATTETIEFEEAEPLRVKINRKKRPPLYRASCGRSFVTFRERVI